MSEKIKYVRCALVALLLCLCAAVQAQSVSGNVKDALGEAVIGATVMEQGTKNGTVTDMDGNFTIKLQGKSHKLVLSYVGMKSKTVDVAGKSSVNVVLEDDATTLNDLVVVGYGTVKKNDLTGSVSSVGTEQLNAKGAPSVMENLQGMTPGVSITPSSGRVGEGFKVEIRGKSSINSDTTPLFVVDGVMCDDIDWLNPQDIERIDVLKDASSTAIYGSRATAGVVMVTTKGGLNVKKQEKATISYDGYYGWTKTARMPEFMSGEEFYNYRFLKFLSPSVSNSAAQANPAAPTYGMQDAAILGQCLLQTSSADTSSPFIMKQMLASGNTYDWPSIVTRTGEQQNHFLAVKGSSDKINYHVGLGYNSEKGIYQNDDQSRINFKGSLDAKVNDLVSFGFNVNMAHIDNSYADNTAVQHAYRMNPYMTPYDANGNVILKPGNKETLGTDNNQFSDQISPLQYMQNSTSKCETWRMLGNIYLQLDFMKGLNFKTTFSPNYTYYRNGYYEGYEDPLHPNFTYAGPDYPISDDAEATTWSTTEYGTNRDFSWTWDNVVNWNKSFNKIHNVGLMGLFSMQKENLEQSLWKGTNTKLIGSDWWAMENTKQNADDSKTYYKEMSMLSYALRANYSFMDRYLLTATIRWDGSSKFAEGHKWGSFPSFAAAWRVTEEEFMKKIEWLDNLKLRVAYGVTGNCSGIHWYATQSVPMRGSSYALGGVYNNGYTTSIVDKNLQWETSHEFNFGLDFAVLKNRLSGSIDVYSKKSYDLLYAVRLPLEAGVNSEGKPIELTTNIGSVRNTGIEASLTGVIVQNNDWNVSVTANIAHNKNEVLEINGDGDRVANGVTGSLFVGNAVNVLWGYVQDGIVSDQMMTVPNTQIARDKGFTPGQQVKSCDYYYATYGWIEGQPIIRDINGDGKLDPDNDRGFYTADPKFTGSLSTNVSYKNWDFSASLYAKVGQYAYSNFYSEYINWADRGRQKLNVDYYIPAGTLIDCDGINADGTYVNPKYQETTHYGEYPFPNNGNSNGVGNAKANWDEAKCITKASFAKIKNITLGYTFPKKWLKPAGCSHLRLYFTVTNPFVFTNYKGFDPEWASTSLKKDGPSTITYQIGASVKF